MIARFIIEVIGRPEELVIKTLDEIIKSISERYRIENKEVSKPETIGQENLLSGFTELDIEFKNFEDLFLAIIDYGPTVVEIIEPKEIKIKSAELQSALAELVNKIHELSKTVQALKIENIKLKNKTP